MLTQTLYMKEGAADKQYTAALDPDSLTVQLSWGRRGGTVQTKLLTAPTLEAATKLYEAKLNEKLSKGYSLGQDATPLAASNEGAKREVKAPKPMLLNEVGDEELFRCALDEAWFMQEKKDGDRILLVKAGGKITSFSRSGRETWALPETIIKAALACSYESFILDGEIVGDTVYAFDVLAGLQDMTCFPYEDRLGLLRALFGDSKSGIVMVETARTHEDKVAMFTRCKQTGCEGVVLKRRTAMYSPGRPNSFGPALKYKFWASASVIVRAHTDKESVEIELADGMPLGRVSTPKGLPPVGSIAEVKYLYAYRGGSLAQPSFLRIREDIDRSECTAAQLQFKGESK